MNNSRLISDALWGVNSQRGGIDDEVNTSRCITELEKKIKSNSYKIAVFNITHKICQGNTKYSKNILNFLKISCKGQNLNNLKCSNPEYLYYVNNIGVIDKIRIDDYKKLPEKFKCFDLCCKYLFIDYPEYTNNTDVLVREKLENNYTCYKVVTDSHSKWIKLRYCSNGYNDGGHVSRDIPVFAAYDFDNDNPSIYRQCIPYNEKTKHLEGTDIDYEYSMFH